MIYVMGTSASSVVKIGTAKNPKERLKQIQTGHPEQLHLLFEGAGDRTEEAALHQFFAERRVSRYEWFDFRGGNAVTAVSNALDDPRLYELPTVDRPSRASRRAVVTTVTARAFVRWLQSLDRESNDPQLRDELTDVEADYKEKCLPRVLTRQKFMDHVHVHAGTYDDFDNVHVQSAARAWAYYAVTEGLCSSQTTTCEIVKLYGDGLLRCPACGAPSTYIIGRDRFSHADGSDNSGCWAELTRGDGAYRPIPASQPSGDTAGWHALFAAVADAGHPDPLSKRGRS